MPPMGEIKFAYSMIQSDEIPDFLHTLAEIISTSRQREAERNLNQETSGAITLIIPTDSDKDAMGTLTLNRTLTIKAIHTFRLQNIMSS